MPSPRRPALALALVLTAAGCMPRTAAPAAAPAPAIAGPLVVQGTVNYRQRVALPPNAVVRVQLVDAARADTPATVLAEQVIATKGGQVPFAFTLRPPVVAPSARLLLQARIEVDGELRFVSTPAHPVTAQSLGRPIELVVQPAPTAPR
ncbi:MAG TPA: YbaY family lipoprotein [Candidatus Dormibacteraeota bacterium]|nr:YbaY family lipoprotein [Candidatus Dormibacteraeota bacterium]